MIFAVSIIIYSISSHTQPWLSLLRCPKECGQNAFMETTARRVRLICHNAQTGRAVIIYLDNSQNPDYKYNIVLALRRGNVLETSCRSIVIGSRMCNAEPSVILESIPEQSLSHLPKAKRT